MTRDVIIMHVTLLLLLVLGTVRDSTQSDAQLDTELTCLFQNLNNSAARFCKVPSSSNFEQPRSTMSGQNTDLFRITNSCHFNVYFRYASYPGPKGNRKFGEKAGRCNQARNSKAQVCANSSSKTKKRVSCLFPFCVSDRQINCHSEVNAVS